MLGSTSEFRSPSWHMTPSSPNALVMTSTFPRWPEDATPRFVYELARLAASASWNVTVVAPHHPGARYRERAGEIDIRRFVYFRPQSMQRLCYGGGILPNYRASLLARAQAPALVFAETLATRAVMREKKFDLVHAHFLVPQGFVASMLRTPSLVVSVHGSDLFALRGRLASEVQRRVVSAARIVTVNSEAAREALVSRIPSAEPKVRMLPMGIDTSLLRCSDEARSADSLLFVGRLTRQKGVDVLIEAFGEVRRQRPNASLTVIGEGPLRATLESRAGSGIRFVGPLGPTAVAEAYRRAALVVVPSRDDHDGTEALSLVTVEAMASGAPVVATRSGGLRDLIGDDDRGLLAAPGDPRDLARSILEALTRPEQARERAERARTFAVERYRWDAIRSRLLAIYEEAAWG